MPNLRKKLYVIIFFTFTLLHLHAEESAPCNTGTSQIAEEIKNLKENNPYVKKYLAIKDPMIRKYLDFVQNAKLVANMNEPKALANQLIHAGNISRKGLVAIDQTTAPKLYALVKELVDKLNISMPFIFITFDKKLDNAFASTLSGL